MTRLSLDVYYIDISHNTSPMISEKQRDIIRQGILLNFLKSDRTKIDDLDKWIQTLDHTKASPIIAKFLSLKHDISLSGEEWNRLTDELRQELIALGSPFIQ